MPKEKTVYITTPIYYVNAEPHIGHTYTTIIADTIKSFYKMVGGDAYLLTGTDEHGEKIQEKAQENNMEPLAFADMISAKFRNTWDEIGIRYDDFIRTTEQRHVKVVREVLEKVYEKDDIYFGKYEGKYCVGCERFLRDNELVNKKCPDHDREPKIVKESNYFFRMSKYQKELGKYIATHPEFIRPEQYRKEILSFLKEPLEDLCISRPKNRLTWGIELPFDTNYVTYVWFDALLNYVSAIGYPSSPEFDRLWAGVRHLIGKDILKTHAIYWPTMLMSAGIPLYQHLDVHGFWLRGETKMSKSLGNVVNPLEFKNKFGIEPLRYFYLREMSFGSDGNFTYELFLEKYNSDLANGLGNLVNRTCSMVEKYFKWKIPSGGYLDTTGGNIRDAVKKLVSEYEELWENYKMQQYLLRQWEIFTLADQYIEETRPWEIAKDPTQKERLAGILATILEMLRISGILLHPVLPETSLKILSAINAPAFLNGQDNFSKITEWGQLPSGKNLNPVLALFPRMNPEEMLGA